MKTWEPSALGTRRRKRPVVARSRLPSVLREPIINAVLLLLISFVFTTVLGNWLVTTLQRENWGEQQRELRFYEFQKKRYQTLNEVSGSIADYFASAEDVVHYFDHVSGREARSVELVDGLETWNEASHSWKTVHPVHAGMINAQFINREIVEVYYQIVELSRQVDGNIQALALVLSDDTERVRLSDEGIVALKRSTEKAVEGTVGRFGHLERLTMVMIEEIDSDSRDAEMKGVLGLARWRIRPTNRFTAPPARR